MEKPFPIFQLNSFSIFFFHTVPFSFIFPFYFILYSLGFEQWEAESQILSLGFEWIVSFL
jgi:hypothetical protein